MAGPEFLMDPESNTRPAAFLFPRGLRNAVITAQILLRLEPTLIIMENCSHNNQRPDPTQKTWICMDCGVATKSFGTEAGREEIAEAAVSGKQDQWARP